jgi:hypothetical protein
MRGIALPSWLVAACAAVVAVALVAFVVTGERDADVSAAPSESSARPTDGPAATPGRDQGHDRADRDKGEGEGDGKGDKGDKGDRRDKGGQPVERRTAYVEVYNNSGISGLAGSTAALLQDSGWRVVATDNWYGQIPSSTVYYPRQLEAQARLLARDVGVSRLHPAVSPMSFDRLTVILVGPT